LNCFLLNFKVVVIIFIDTSFTYNGISSIDMGVMLVKIDTGMVEQNFGMPRSIITSKIKDVLQPLFYGFEEEPIRFKIIIAKQGEWTTTDRMNICKWLFQNNYRDFISNDDITIIYKCVAIGQPKFYNNANNQGYAEIEFECDAPHAWSPVFVRQFDLSSNTTSITIEVENKSNMDDIYHYPEIEFTLVDDATSFKLVNLQDGGRIFEFTGLEEQETVYINNKTKYIKSDTGLYRLSNLTDKQFFRMVYGINNVEVFGKCLLTIRSQFPIVV